MKHEQSHLNINDILDEYRPDEDIFCDEDEKIHKIKKIIYDKLSESDRRIILLYTEAGNLRDVAKLLNVSFTTVYYQIKRIRKIINDNL